MCAHARPLAYSVRSDTVTCTRRAISFIDPLRLACILYYHLISAYISLTFLYTFYSLLLSSLFFFRPIIRSYLFFFFFFLNDPAPPEFSPFPPPAPLPI